MDNNQNIFKQPLWVSIFALIAAIGWGWAYPLIKLGFAEFGITSDMTAAKILFAGIRFCFSGLIIIVVALKMGRSFKIRYKKDWLYILLFSITNTTLHYAFFYFGLSHSEGSRAAILNSLNVFSVVIFACIFFKSDKLTLRKIIGCTIGFIGIISLNMGSSANSTFTWLGDGMIILNALCGAAASLLVRGIGKRIDVFVGTGIALFIGGLLLLIPGLIMCETMLKITFMGCIYLLLLISISTIGFTLYNKLISCNPVGKVAIYNSLIPIVGAITSCMCLNETFQLKYIIAGILASIGIYVINKGKK